MKTVARETICTKCSKSDNCKYVKETVNLMGIYYETLSNIEGGFPLEIICHNYKQKGENEYA